MKHTLISSVAEVKRANRDQAEALRGWAAVLMRGYVAKDWEAVGSVAAALVWTASELEEGCHE